jgi:hypothetical protein
MNKVSKPLRARQPLSAKKIPRPCQSRPAPVGAGSDWKIGRVAIMRSLPTLGRELSFRGPLGHHLADHSARRAVGRGLFRTTEWRRTEINVSLPPSRVNGVL